MAKYQSKKKDLIVSGDKGVIKFIDGFFTSKNKWQEELLAKAKNVKMVGTPPPVQQA